MNFRISQIITASLTSLLVAACLQTPPEDFVPTTSEASTTDSSGAVSTDSNSETGAGILTTTEGGVPTTSDTGESSTSTGSSSSDTGNSSTGEGAHPVVFVTEVVLAGDIKGVTGGTTICQASADAVKLPGNYVAWLADGGSEPADFLDMTNDSPILFPSGATAFPGGFAGVSADMPHATYFEDMNGEQIGSNWALWTNVSSAGTRSSDEHCDNWMYTGNAHMGRHGWVGEPSEDTEQTNSTWTSYGSVSCGVWGRLICFQINQ